MPNNEIFRTIVETIRSSLDISKTKQSIVDIVGKTLKADRCFILEYDKSTDKFLPVNEEYLSSWIMRSYKEADLNERIPKLALEFKKGKIFRLNELKAFLDNESIDMNDGSFEEEKKEIEEYKVYSALVFPLYHFDNFLGDLVLHYVDKRHEAGEEEISLIKDIASQIATALYQSGLYKATQENAKREQIFRNIVETIRNNIDIEQTRKIIVNTIGKALNADRCFITDYDKNKDKFLTIKYEYLSSDKILSCLGRDINEDIPNFAKATKSGKSILVKNKKIFFDSEEQDLEFEKKIMEQYSVNSMFAIPLFYQNELLAVLSAHFTDESRQFSDFEINLMTDIANQTAIAIHQSNLYKLTKMQAETESLLRKIIEESRKSLILEDVLMNICKEITNLFKIERVSIGQISQDKKNNTYITVEHGANKHIKLSKDFVYFNMIELYWKKYLFENKKTKAIKNIQESDLDENVKKKYKEMGVKSIICVPIKSEDFIWGGLFLSEYASYKEWGSEQIKLLETIASQIYIAIRQSELYCELNLTTSNLNSILDNIPYWVWLKNTEGVFILVNKEYAEAKNLTVKTFVGKTDFDLYPKEIAELYVKDDKEVMETRMLKNIKEEVTFVNGEKRFVETYKKPFLNEKGEVIGTIGIAKDITQRKMDELELLQRQEQIIKAGEREFALRTIIDIIRSSLDIDEIKEKFVTEVGKYFNANRCFIYEFGNGTKSGIFKEYTSSPEVKRMSEEDFEAPQYKYWEKTMFGQDLILTDLKQYIIENNLINTPVEEHIEEFSIKTAIGIPILYADELYGELIIQYTENVVNLDSQDMNFIKNLAAQVGIAMHQASLYNLIQLQVEREKINRSIVEILRSSLDKTMIKKLFVKNIGKLFNADIVYLAEYDTDKKIFIPVNKDSEYLSFYKEKSFVGYDWTNKDVAEYIQPLLEREELNIYCLEEYLQQTPRSQGFINLFKNAGIKSSYNFPVVYFQNIMGFLSINFTANVRRLSEEDLFRLRDICTQYAIALYQAELYLKARQCVFARELILLEISDKIKEPANKILKASEYLSENEFERAIQMKYLDNIIENCHQILELINDKFSG